MERLVTPPMRGTSPSRGPPPPCEQALIQGYFSAIQNYAGIAELSKCSWYPKRSFGGNHAFFRGNTVELQFGKKKTPSIALYFTIVFSFPFFFFRIIVA